MGKLLIAAAFGLLASAASAIPPLPPPGPPAPRPRLVIEISADQLSSDVFTRYRPHFTGGLARLARGTVFSNASAAPVGATQTIGALVENVSPGSTTVVVAGDQATATALGGPDADQRWYWNGPRFVTDLSSPPPRTIAQANAAIASMIAEAQPPLVPPPACGQSAAMNAGARFGRAAGDVMAYSASPALDGAVLALSAALAHELRLGADAAPDVLSIGLPATARVAQRFGPASEAMCLQLLSLDRDLGDFFTLLDRGNIDYSVMLKGRDAAGAAVPLMFWRRGMITSERPEPVSTADALPTLAAILGMAPPADIAGECLGGVPGIACLPR